MNNIDNPMISIYRQAFEPSYAELARARRQRNKSLAETLDDIRSNIDTINCAFGMFEDILYDEREFHGVIYNLKSAMQLLENLANRLEGK